METGAVVAMPKALQQPAVSTAVGPGQPGRWTEDRELGELGASWARLEAAQQRETSVLSWDVQPRKGRTRTAGFGSCGRDGRQAGAGGRRPGCAHQAQTEQGGGPGLSSPAASLVIHVQHWPLPPGLGVHLAARPSPSLCQAQGLCQGNSQPCWTLSWPRALKTWSRAVCRGSRGVWMGQGRGRVWHNDHTDTRVLLGSVTATSLLMT